MSDDIEQAPSSSHGVKRWHKYSRYESTKPLATAFYTKCATEGLQRGADDGNEQKRLLVAWARSTPSIVISELEYWPSEVPSCQMKLSTNYYLKISIAGG
jgi:hypothetical protein